MHGAQIKIGRIREAFKEFVRRQGEGRKFAKKHYIRGEKEIKDASNQLRIMYKAVPPIKDTVDFDASEFMDSSAISQKTKIRGNLKLKKKRNAVKK